jgi:hypothetical protein
VTYLNFIPTSFSNAILFPLQKNKIWKKCINSYKALKVTPKWSCFTIRNCIFAFAAEHFTGNRLCTRIKYIVDSLDVQRFKKNKSIYLFWNTLNDNVYWVLTQDCNVWRPKTYTLARFEPGLFCSVGGRDDHYAMPRPRAAALRS